MSGVYADGAEGVGGGGERPQVCVGDAAPSLHAVASSRARVLQDRVERGVEAVPRRHRPEEGNDPLHLGIACGQLVSRAASSMSGSQDRGETVTPLTMIVGVPMRTLARAGSGNTNASFPPPSRYLRTLPNEIGYGRSSRILATPLIRANISPASVRTTVASSAS